MPFEKVIGDFIPDSTAATRISNWTEYERGKAALFEVYFPKLPPEYVVLFVDYLPYWDFIDNYIMEISGGRACVGWYKADGSGLTSDAETWSTYVDDNGDRFYLAKVV